VKWSGQLQHRNKVTGDTEIARAKGIVRDQICQLLWQILYRVNTRRYLLW